MPRPLGDVGKCGARHYVFYVDRSRRVSRSRSCSRTAGAAASCYLLAGLEGNFFTPVWTYGKDPYPPT